MSLSATRRPQILWKTLREGLKKREWRVFYHHEDACFGAVIRPKKKVFLQLMSSYGHAEAIPNAHTRKKFPRSRYIIRVPWIQKDYNKHKLNVDSFNKLTLSYRQVVQFQSADQAYFHFFLQALTVNSFIFWKHLNPGKADQLIFRLELLRSLQLLLKSETIPRSRKWHYPVRSEKMKSKCQKEGCRNRSWRFCEACEVSMCQVHLDEHHSSPNEN